jgi:hypothetical protein
MTSVAPDGSPVAFYLRIPAMGEPELVHGVVPRMVPGSSERLAPRLTDQPVAPDRSALMPESCS